MDIDFIRLLFHLFMRCAEVHSFICRNLLCLRWCVIEKRNNNNLKWFLFFNFGIFGFGCTTKSNWRCGGYDAGNDDDDGGNDGNVGDGEGMSYDQP